MVEVTKIDRLVREDWTTGEGFVYVKAVAEIRIPYEDHWISQRIESPGVYGIEDGGERERSRGNPLGRLHRGVLGPQP